MITAAQAEQTQTAAAFIDLCVEIASDLNGSSPGKAIAELRRLAEQKGYFGRPEQAGTYQNAVWQIVDQHQTVEQRDYTASECRRILSRSRQEDDARHAEFSAHFEEAKQSGNGSARQEQRPLPWLNMSSWDDGEPPPIEWSITNLVPREQVGLFSGVGGTGKTTTELLKDVAHVIGLRWFNWMPIRGPVLFVGCEDTDRVWRIRLTVIAKHFQTTFAELIASGFHLLNLYGQDATLFHHVGKSGRVEATPLFQRIYQAAGDLKPVNISLDPLARIFAGNEMDRSHPADR
jgi:RecA-family ATPase